ncbi:hypothetical protein ACIBQ1_26715 [Nonomuraea sp. NPDC050153]|uniref:hypothetical protein n=1 Tax=Nonomuraea sp. NPDC050153 TaxID=3364359 RepID=UPI0037BAD200
MIQALIAKGALRQVSGGHNGHRAVYEIPPLDPEVIAQGPENPDPSAVKRPENRDPSPVLKGPENQTEGSGKGGGSVRESRTPSPQSPQGSSSPRGPARVVMNMLGVDRVEAEQIVAAIEADKRPRNVLGYITALARNDDLADWQGHVREQDARQLARGRRRPAHAALLPARRTRRRRPQPALRPPLVRAVPGRHPRRRRPAAHRNRPMTTREFPDFPDRSTRAREHTPGPARTPVTRNAA